jgi:toxin ParE1/3/4
MIYEVKTADHARFDLKMIYEYIANVLMEPIVAEKQYSRIENAIYSLNQMPERFRQYEKEPWRSRNLRIMPIDNYIVFYTVDNKNRTATAIRIMYGARNIKKELDDMVQQDS